MIVPAELHHVGYILDHLRPADRDELLAMSDMEHPIQLMPRFRQILGDDRTVAMAVLAGSGEPTAIFGIVKMYEGVGVAFAFGTPRWPKTVREMFIFCRREFTPNVVKVCFHRVECRVLAGRPDVDRFLLALDFHPEMALPMVGRRQEDFVQWAWLGGAGRAH